MTVSTTTSRIAYNGNGVTLAFAFPYLFLADTDLDVYVDGALKALTTDYTVSGAGADAGGTVTFLVAPGAGSGNVVIVRDPDLLQSTDLPPNDPFPANSVERMSDKLTLIAQRLYDLITRAFRLSDTDVSGASTSIATAVAGQFIRWKTPVTDGLESADIATSGAIGIPVSVAQGGTNATTAAGARTNLGGGATGVSVFTSATVAAALAALKTTVTDRAANTILALADIGIMFRATAGFTQTLTAAATLGAGWWCGYRVESGATVVLDPNGAELIDGAATKSIVGPASGFIWCNGTAFYTNGFPAAAGLPTGFLFGCTLSNNGTDAVNDIDITAGKCRDSTDTVNITCAAMAGKQLDVGWAPGAAAGLRNSGAAIANGTYHIYAVSKADGTQDYYAHTSTTVATVIAALQAEAGGAAYLYARRIGSIIRSGGSILGFVQYGDYFRLNAAVLDVNTTNPGTAAVTAALSVPSGINVIADINAAYNPNNTAGASLLLTDLASTDVAPVIDTATQGQIAYPGNTGTTYATAPVQIRTNTSAQCRYRASFSNASTVVALATQGWRDQRGVML